MSPDGSKSLVTLGLETYLSIYPPGMNHLSLENTQNVILDHQLLAEIQRWGIELPVILELKSSSGKKAYGTCYRFSRNNPGAMHVPFWMMKNLGVSSGDIVKIRSIAIPPATSIKLQPHDDEWLNIPEPLQFLSTRISKFSVLAQGDTLVCYLGPKRFCFNVIDVQPSKVSSIIRDGMEVELRLELVPSVLKTEKELLEDIKSVRTKMKAQSQGAIQVAAENRPPANMSLPVQTDSRCWICRKGLGFHVLECSCGYKFCSGHRYPWQHNCVVDYLHKNKQKLQKEMPQVTSNKGLDRM